MFKLFWSWFSGKERKLADRELVVFASGAVGDYVPFDQPRSCPAALIVHGWNAKPSSSTYSNLQNLLNEAGYCSLILTLRGHAEANGNLKTVTRAMHTEDITAAFRWLGRRKEVNPQKIVGVGTSYGAYLLACLAGTGFVALALRSPALYPDDAWEEPTSKLIEHSKLWAWRAQQRDAEEVRAFRELKKFLGPLLLIWGDGDEDIPENVFRSYEYVAGSNCKRTLILSGAGHVLAGEYKRRYLQQTAYWAQNLLANSLL